jgi:hypothetical protein
MRTNWLAQGLILKKIEQSHYPNQILKKVKSMMTYLKNFSDAGVL